MNLPITVFLLASLRLSGADLSVCTLSRGFAAYRNRQITVRGVYYHGLREEYSAKCADGPWPAFVALSGPQENGEALERAVHRAVVEAKRGRKLEIWVSAVGRLRTMAQRSSLGPCDRIGSHYSGYGHLGVAPAELVVERFQDIEIRENPKSPYDYSTFRKSPAQ